jgi:hypothetical protein
MHAQGMPYIFYGHFKLDRVICTMAQPVQREDRCPISYSTGKGGPSNAMPYARHNSGYWGGIALTLVTPRKKASILPAG